MADAKNPKDSKRPRRPPATTPEDRERQLVALAYDVAEKQLQSGNATSQVITQFLKVGAQREKLELERLRNENALLQAKIDNLAAARQSESMYEQAIEAMRRYSGEDEEGPQERFDD